MHLNARKLKLQLKNMIFPCKNCYRKSENITEMAITKEGPYYRTIKRGVEVKVYFLPENKSN
jgi:hypothetical protein